METVIIVLAVLLGLSLIANIWLLRMWFLTAEALKQDEKIIKASREVLNKM